MRLETPSNLVNEQTIVIRHKHWISVAPIILATILLILALIPISMFYAQHQVTINQFIPVAAIGIITLAYIVLVLLILVLATWVYWSNRIVLTNRHIVQYTRLGVFSHSISQLSLDDIEDVTYKQDGVLANLLDYGSIIVETAGEQLNFIFTYLPDPEPLAAQIIQAHENCKIRPTP